MSYTKEFSHEVTTRTFRWVPLLAPVIILLAIIVLGVSLCIR